MAVGRLAFSCPTPSYDGRYWAKYPNGNAPSSLTSAALAAAFAAGDLRSAFKGAAVAGSSATGVIGQFSTNFPTTENPLSQGGAFASGAQASPRTNAQSLFSGGQGRAFGTMVSTSGGTDYEDSCAILTAPFSANQFAQATIWNVGAVPGLEVELLLRGTISAGFVQCYEVDFVIEQGGFINITDWKGDPHNLDILASTFGSGFITYNDGDVVYADIVGTLITVKINGVTMLTCDTSTFPGSNYPITVGSPGISFWNQTGDAANSPNFAFKNFAAGGLP